MKGLQKKGFTLVEAVIAISILAIIGVILLNFIFVSYNIRNTNQQRQEALKLATSLVDEIKSYQADWKNVQGLKNWLASNSFSLSADSLYYIKEKTDRFHILYGIKVSIREDIGVSGLFQVEVTVHSEKVNHLSIITRFRG